MQQEDHKDTFHFFLCGSFCDTLEGEAVQVSQKPDTQNKVNMGGIIWYLILDIFLSLADALQGRPESS